MGQNAGLSNQRPAGRMRPNLAINVAPQKIANFYKHYGIPTKNITDITKNTIQQF